MGELFLLFLRALEQNKKPHPKQNIVGYLCCKEATKGRDKSGKLLNTDLFKINEILR